MTKEETKEAIREIMEDKGVYMTYENSYGNMDTNESAIEKAIEAIAELFEGERVEYEWIAVDKTPMENFGRSFTIDANESNPQPSIMWYNHYANRFEINGMPANPTHWLPLNTLPKPPKLS